jgi:hypothetical protein
MKGLEMMLSNMLGMKPEQMRQTFEGIAKAADNAVEGFARIEAKQDLILAALERIENGPGRIGEDRSGSGSESGD